MGHLWRKPGRTIWMMKYYRDGRPINESSHTDNRRKANKLMMSKEVDIDRGVPVTNKVGRLRFEEAMKDVIADYVANQYDTLDDTQGRIDNHLTPFFGGRRMATITKADIAAYIAHRIAQPIVTGKGKNRKSRRPSNGAINRELGVLKRAFTLALHNGKLLYAPYIEELEEKNVRKGFFEREQLDAVLAHLPEELQAVVEFAFITGWRVDSEVLTLEWRHVHFDACEVRLEPGETKNGEARTFPFTTALYALLLKRKAVHDEWAQKGHLCPYVFFRLMATGRGGPKSPRKIIRFDKTWRPACVKAGVPGKWLHDFRRTASRNLVRSLVHEKVAMGLTGHKTRSVFDRYNIVSPRDYQDAIGRYDTAQEQATKRPR